jgi:hypothetical protein
MAVVSDELRGERGHVLDQGTLRLAAEHHVQLLDGDRDADAREHAVHDGGGQREGEPPDPGDAQQDLDNAGGAGDAGGRGPAELGDETGDDNGQAGGRTADLQRGTAERSGDHTADHRGHQAGDQRRAGGGGDSEGERDCDQEDH